MTQGRVLVLNAGSATLKATVLDRPSSEPRFDRTVDWSTGDGSDAGATLDEVIDAIGEAGTPLDSIKVVGHRVVHGGEAFVAPTVIDDTVLTALDATSDLAPLHNPAAVATIRAARARLPGSTHVADFDTAFHATLPAVARRYPVPDDWVDDHGIRRFGFHGLSVEWSLSRAADLLERPAESLRLVVAHLGGGCSVTAVDGGRSADTSMGLTPMEGLMMATRAGSIDPGIVFRLLRAGLAVEDIEQQLDRESGLRGVGGSADMRDLLTRAGQGDVRALLAIDLFVRRATAGIAAAATVLPALDALVFTGGIGEHATTVRARICAGLRLFGVPAVDDRDDRDLAEDAIIAQVSSKPAVLKVHAREDIVIAEHALGHRSGPDWYG